MPDTAWDNDLTFLEVNDDAVTPGRKPLIRETAFTLYVNDQRWVTLLCTPTDLDALTLGFIRTEPG